MYRLVTKSKLSSALEFEKWVYEDVLPSIRKYGMYATDELLEDDEKFMKMKEQLKAEKSEVQKLTKSNKSLNIINRNLQNIVDDSLEALDEAKPILKYVDEILASDLTMTPTQIAFDYGISAVKLNQILEKHKVHRRVSKQWILYKKYMNQGYTESETFVVNRKFIIQTKWTQRGRLLIHNILQEYNIFPTKHYNSLI